MPDVEKGPVPQPGQGEQLPQGAAAQLNEATPPDAALEQAAGAPMMNPSDMMGGTPGPVEFADERMDGTERFRVTTDDEEIMFSDPPIAKPVRLGQDKSLRVPTNVVRHMMMLAAQAQDPGAPDSVRALYRAILNHLEAEMRQGNA